MFLCHTLWKQEKGKANDSLVYRTRVRESFGVAKSEVNVRGEETCAEKKYGQRQL